MTLEEQKTAELAQAEADAKAEAELKAKADLEAETDEEKAAREAEEEKLKNKIDYETELKREQDRRISAEKATADISFKLREQKRKEKEYDEDGNLIEEKPLTASQLEDILQRDRQTTRKEFQSELISEKAKKLAGSEAEANYIVEIHKNRTFPEGLSLDEQLEESYAIANRKTLIAQNAELKRALRGKETVSDLAAGTHRDSPALDEPKMSSNDIQAIKATGFVWDGKARLYIKQLGGKRILTYDPKTKIRKVIEK